MDSRAWAVPLRRVGVTRHALPLLRAGAIFALLWTQQMQKLVW